MKPSIVWFRDDLRVADNPALRAAVDDGAAVALYVLDEESEGLRPHGGASRWWLHHSLVSLREDLAALGIPLLLRRGDAASVVQKTTTALGAGGLYW
ncbi:deoxyribodipyrimidine photo-lyase, partial [Paenarthrobacter nicotinovorans]